MTCIDASDQGVPTCAYCGEVIAGTAHTVTMAKTSLTVWFCTKEPCEWVASGRQPLIDPSEYGEAIDEVRRRYFEGGAA